MRKAVFSLLILLIISGIWVALSSKDNYIPIVNTNAEIVDFYLSKPNLVIESRNLSGVDIYASPGDPESEDYLLGEADLVESFGQMQTWIFPIPEPEFLREIYTIGYDLALNQTENVYFPIIGVSSIYESLWVNVPEKTLTLSLGESSTVGESEFLFGKVLEDSRCPVEVNCIQAGRIVIEVVVDGKSIVISNTDEEVKVGNYFIKISGVFPDANHEGISLDRYRLTLSVISSL
ncbi:MAG: hypothetical protein MRY49_02825 [Candidatus Pacebacteria bacterium]|nr:hypothetical protein [Candidatus Paceibacterota bacterium]